MCWPKLYNLMKICRDRPGFLLTFKFSLYNRNDVTILDICDFNGPFEGFAAHKKDAMGL